MTFLLPVIVAPITVGLIYISSALLTPALAGERDIAVISPLERVNPIVLDKARGVGPRFRFYSAPSELSLPCALSVRVRVNEGDFVGHVTARTMQEIRSEIAGKAQLNPNEAERAPINTSFALRGEGPISSAMCGNTKSGADASGYCAGTISGSDYTIAYNFDPVPCRYDNVAVAKALEARLSVSSGNEQHPEPDCATKLEGFIAEIDELLGKHPHRMGDVDEVLNRHFPLHGCRADVVSDIVKRSKYFQSEGVNGPKTRVFVLTSKVASSRGVLVSFALTNTGDSLLPSAMWDPPFP